MLESPLFNKNNRYSVKNLLYLGILLCRDVKMVTILFIKKYLIDIIDPYLLSHIEAEAVHEELVQILKIAADLIPTVALLRTPTASSSVDRSQHQIMLQKAIGPTLDAIYSTIGRSQPNYERDALTKALPVFILRTFTLRKFMESVV